jgi:hypothetical protein
MREAKRNALPVQGQMRLLSARRCCSLATPPFQGRVDREAIGVGSDERRQCEQTPPASHPTDARHPPLKGRESRVIIGASRPTSPDG